MIQKPKEEVIPEKTMNIKCPSCGQPTEPEKTDLWEETKCKNCGAHLMIHFGTEIGCYYMYRLKGTYNEKTGGNR